MNAANKEDVSTNFRCFLLLFPRTLLFFAYLLYVMRTLLVLRVAAEDVAGATIVVMPLTRLATPPAPEPGPPDPPRPSVDIPKSSSNVFLKRRPTKQ